MWASRGLRLKSYESLGALLPYIHYLQNLLLISKWSVIAAQLHPVPPVIPSTHSDTAIRAYQQLNGGDRTRSSKLHLV